MKEETFVPREPKLREDFTETALGLNLDMIYVEGGKFEMGATEEQGDDADGDEEPVRTVKLDGYHIGKYPVTQAQWVAVMGMRSEWQWDKMIPYYKDAYRSYGSYGIGDTHPMYYVSWEEAHEFCRRLSEVTGRKYMLPTEAQWEYAARGGSKSRHYKYAGDDDIDEVAWYWENSVDLSSERLDSAIQPVGMKKANELGIYDMSGNVGEWCSDWYDDYDGNDNNNPQGPVSGLYRVARGGSWDDDVWLCRVSYRYFNNPNSCFADLGFRVVCIL